MSAEALLSLFGGASGGTALVMLVLFITNLIYSKGSYDDLKARLEDMKEQRDEWKKTAELERARAEAGVIAGQVARDLVVSLRKELE